MNEKLRHMTVHKEGDDFSLLIQLSDGGAQCFLPKDTDALVVIRHLRELADNLERGVKARKVEPSPYPYRLKIPVSDADIIDSIDQAMEEYGRDHLGKMPEAIELTYDQDILLKKHTKYYEFCAPNINEPLKVQGMLLFIVPNE